MPTTASDIMGDQKSPPRSGNRKTSQPHQLVNPKLIWKLSRRGVGDGEIYTPIDIAFLPNGHVVVCELMNERLQLFDLNGKVYDVIGEGDIRPRSIVTDKVEGNIAATDQRHGTVRMYGPDGDDMGMWKKKLFQQPNGIAVTSDDCFIITDLANGNVHLFEPEGIQITQFGGQTGKDSALICPSYVTVDQHDRIIISDSENHCIKVFDPDGKFLSKFGGKGTANGQLYAPNGVAADYHGNILVADNGNHRVSMFSSSGKFIEHTLSERDGIMWPEGLAISDAGRLGLTEFGIENDFVKMFQIWFHHAQYSFKWTCTN